MLEDNISYRMYGLTPYNISPIQQGIQFGHAVVEYAQSCFNDDDYQKWVQKDKTFIILNGGTSSTMVQNMNILKDNGVEIATFNEPDLNDMLSAVVFLVDSRVYDRENYPDFYNYMSKIKGRRDLPNLKTEEERAEFVDAVREMEAPFYTEWVEFIGGEENIFLRNYLTNFKLA